MKTANHTPIYDKHKSLNARFINFFGWEMPLYYEGAIVEHNAVRRSVGVFDVSHMGEIEITGPGAEDLTQKITTNNVSNMKTGDAQYSLMCYPSGGIVDDLIVYKLSDDHFLLCVNASNIEKDFNWIKQNCFGDVSVANISSKFGQIAVQGRYAENVVQKISDDDILSLKSFTFTVSKIGNAEVIISRTGYTGEDGFELYVPQDKCAQIWDAVLESGKSCAIKPAGLSARDTLRLEMGYMLYGNDIHEHTNPEEAGLSWVVKMENGDFIGKTSMLNYINKGTQRKISGIAMEEKGIPRPKCAVFKEGKQVGEVTSGTYSPSLKKPIGLAYIDSRLNSSGEDILVDIRGKMVKAVTCCTPFYRPKRD